MVRFTIRDSLTLDPIPIKLASLRVRRGLDRQAPVENLKTRRIVGTIRVLSILENIFFGSDLKVQVRPPSTPHQPLFGDTYLSDDQGQSDNYIAAPKKTCRWNV